MGGYWFPIWLQLPIPVFSMTNVIFRWTQTKTTNSGDSDERLPVASLVSTTNSYFLDDRRNYLLDPYQDNELRPKPRQRTMDTLMSNYWLPVWLRLVPIPVFSATGVIFRWTQTKTTNAGPKPRQTLETLMGDYWLPIWLRLPIPVFSTTDVYFPLDPNQDKRWRPTTNCRFDGRDY